MPLTPETWLDQFTVNLTTAGNQSDPEITQLANGNILVCWTTNDPAGLGSPAGDEVFAQLFDPLGTRIGVEFRLNSSSTADNERNAQVAALPDGGFIVVYHDNDIAGTGGSNIRIQEYDANGVGVSENSLVISDSGSASDPNYSNPRIAVSSATSVLIVYEEITAGSANLVGKIYNTVTDTYGAQFVILTDGDSMTNADVTVLTNGNYVITGNRSFTDNTIEYRILDSAGGSVLGATIVTGTNTNVQDDGEASVTALTGGGFVIVWTNTDTNDTDILGRVYDAAGAQTGTFSAGDTGATNNNNEPVVAGLADGSFVVVYDNDELDQLQVTHFDSAGSNVGTFTIAASAVTNPVVTDLGDGRFSVAWSDAAGEISMEILDTRDAPNNPGVYIPDQWVVGTVGDDVFTPAANAEVTHGWDGNDIITESGGTRDYFGDNGDDTLIVVSSINSDRHDGGAGTNTIDWSGSVEDTGTFDLQAGLATDSGSDSEVMVGFTNLIGTANNDTIFGTNDENILTGGAGNDTINGRGGVDTMAGGTGNDTFFLDNDLDVVQETAGGGTLDRVVVNFNYILGAGIDVERINTGAVGAVAAINLTGNELSQLLIGNAGINILSAGAAGGADTMTGLAGNDTYRVFNSGDIINEIAGDGTADRVITTTSFTLNANDDIEFLNTSSAAGLTVINLTGNALGQVIIGNAAGNIISGGAAGGTDTLNGQSGDDIYRVFNSTDIVIEAAGNGTADRVNAATSFNLAVDDDIGVMATISSAGVTAINLRGNGLDQSLFGNAGANRLNGGGGADTMTGALGADVFIFQAALGATNIDRITDYNVAADRIEIDNSAFVGLALGALAATAFASNVTGTASTAAHRIIYETDTGFLWFDADGSGAGARIQFADLASGLAMAAGEFTVV